MMEEELEQEQEQEQGKEEQGEEEEEMWQRPIFAGGPTWTRAGAMMSSASLLRQPGTAWPSSSSQKHSTSGLCSI